jgi:hypothetical protein
VAGSRLLCGLRPSIAQFAVPFDKLGVTGSSPVAPIEEKPRLRGFSVSAVGNGFGGVATEWQRLGASG